MVNTFAHFIQELIYDQILIARRCKLGSLFFTFVLNRFADASPERASGSEMDEQRKQQMAYQYLCHLEEAKVYVEVEPINFFNSDNSPT